jgi:hypothetical protein
MIQAKNILFIDKSHSSKDKRDNFFFFLIMKLYIIVASDLDVVIEKKIIKIVTVNLR